MQPCNPIGYVHSLESFGSVDGPGVRFVVFLQGCALRCKYCHNPETWAAEGGEEWTAEKLFQRVYRYRNYWGKKGGITVSGGEPLRQMEFLTAFFELARSKGVTTNRSTMRAIPWNICSVSSLRRCSSIRSASAFCRELPVALFYP